jgi:hypothetical protein
MHLATDTGLRRASINSLRCEQFERSKLEKCQSQTFRITPDHQKFGYTSNLEVPINIALRVCEFIETHRKDLLKSKGWDKRTTADRVFISERSGKPLQDQTISAIFHGPFAELEAPRGANIHSLRRKFANDCIEEELRARQLANFDTSTASVAAAVAIRMNHANPDSLSAYIDHAQSQLAKESRGPDATQNRQLKDENRRLKLKIAELKSQQEKAGV